MRRLVNWCSKGHFDDVTVNAMHGWKTYKNVGATFQQLPNFEIQSTSAKAIIRQDSRWHWQQNLNWAWRHEVDRAHVVISVLQRHIRWLARSSWSNTRDRPFFEALYSLSRDQEWEFDMACSVILADLVDLLQ